eukprot:TRINITY_DN108611_c0_g1_i1.p1 TRINITY_DN108611_c0_g1~~TRINITY_DN108611_c0_g1_i1.p1  ORF type:complete len:251 (-),score=31.06 TRINITY_DN108611_c0_g1_i1:172-885(-)
MAGDNSLGQSTMDQADAVKEVLQMPGNDRCFDCEAYCADDAWVSMNHATVICIDCAGIHRGFGVQVSYVRSLKLDTMKEAEVQELLRGGNNLFQHFLEEPAYSVERHVWLAMPVEARYFTPAADLYRRQLKALREGEGLPEDLRPVRPPALSPNNHGPSAGRPVWTKDEDAPRCQLCKSDFNLFTRRHHCRKCGRCICGSCSPPESMRPLPEFGYTEPCRQCKVCVPPPARLMPGMS